MTQVHHLALVPMSLLLLLTAMAATATAAADPEEGSIRISMQYATEEESRWLDRWAAKYQSPPGSGADSFSVQPATDEESAWLNRMFSDGKKRAGVGSHDGDQDGGARAGFDGRIEFDDDHPFGRIVVEKIHTRARSSKPNDDDLQKNQEKSHTEYDVKDL